MTLEFDISKDFASVTDGLKAVDVGSRVVKNCLRRSVSTKEAAASGGKYLASDTVFHLDADQHGSRPGIGVQIADQSGLWTILSVELQTLLNRWRCVCRQLWIDPSLTVTIQSATFAKGTTGAEEPTWTTAAADVVAKIHRRIETVEVGHANRTTTQLADVFFTTDQTLGPSYRIIGPDDEVLKVVSWEGFSETDQFFVAKCEVSKWPLA